MNLHFEKYLDGLIPTIVQDAATGSVLMLGFMNAEALGATEASGKVTFYSRSKRRLWTKGETSGNFLEARSITADCDGDTLLIKVTVSGPVCHTGELTCFGAPVEDNFLLELEQIINDRKLNPVAGSYVSGLFAAGLNRVAQKVGEEAVEAIIAAKDDGADAFINEAADLLFHYLILLNQKDLWLEDIVDIMKKRHRGNSAVS